MRIRRIKYIESSADWSCGRKKTYVECAFVKPTHEAVGAEYVPSNVWG